MKRLLVLSLLTLACLSAAHAETCAEQATSKKLAGAAKTSFMKKCTAEQADTCTVQSDEKNWQAPPRTVS